MDFISLLQEPHDFEKVNFVTLQDKNGLYDLYKCKHCGLQGKRYGFSNNILVDITLKKVKLCDNRKIEEKTNENLGKVRIKLLPCVLGIGNLKEGDIVDIIREAKRGVWIKCEESTKELLEQDPNYNGELLLLFDEFERVD